MAIRWPLTAAGCEVAQHPLDKYIFGGSVNIHIHAVVSTLQLVVFAHQLGRTEQRFNEQVKEVVRAINRRKL